MGAFENQSGKVSAKVFKEELLETCGAKREEVISGPAFGVDTAFIDLGGGQVLAVSSDPLSLIPSLGMEISAWLSVHLLANDMSTTGKAPQYAQFVLNLPVSLSREQFSEYWNHIHTLCKQMDIAITGGHTGQIPGQESTISGGGTMFLKAPKEKLISSDRASAGDCIIVTKELAISSTSLLSMTFPETVKAKCGAQVQQVVAEKFWKLSVLNDSLIASDTLIPNLELMAMHDVTEGGVLGSLQEMADASGCGFEVEMDKLPISQEVQLIADAFDIDPFVSLGSGSMLMAAKSGCEEELINKLNANGIPAAKIGEFTQGHDKVLINSQGEEKPFEFDGVDPYWNAFFHAYQSGWK